MAAKNYILVVAGACALALAGCNSGTTGKSGLSTAPPVVAATNAGASATPTPAVTVTKTVAAPPTNTSTPVKPITGCTTSQINVVVGQESGAAGTEVQEIDLHNTSAVTCTLDGHPFVAPYGMLTQGSSKVEGDLEVTVDPIPSNFGTLGAAATKQTLTHGDYAIFFIKWSQVPVGSDPCDNADGFDFRTPADKTIQHLIKFSFTVCGSEIQVSNVMSKSNGI